MPTSGRSPSTCTTAGASTASSTDAAPSRKTERSTSGRSSSSLVGPWKRISPFSMKYAVSATVSATFTDCSTRITVVPCSLSRCTATRSSATTLGARPSESSSIISRRGRDSSAMERVSICCWPPLRLAAGSCIRCSSDGEHLQHVRHGLRAAGLVTIEPARQPQVLVDGQRREHALSARDHDDAPGRDLVGRGVGGVAPVEHDRPAVGGHHAGDGLQERRLAGAVGAEQRDDLALVDLEVHAEQHLDVVVAHVDVADEQQLHLALSNARGAPRPGPPSRSTPG